MTTSFRLRASARAKWLWFHLIVGLLLGLVSLPRPAHGSAKAVHLPACAEPPAGTPQLTSYVGVEVPAKYWVEMVWQDGVWQPAEHLAMPFHHATRIELTNINSADFTSLAAHHRHRVRLTLELQSREIRKVPDRYQWRTTYYATILDACLPSSSH